MIMRNYKIFEKYILGLNIKIHFFLILYRRNNLYHGIDRI